MPIKQKSSLISLIFIIICWNIKKQFIVVHLGFTPKLISVLLPLFLKHLLISFSSLNSIDIFSHNLSSYKWRVSEVIQWKFFNVESIGVLIYVWSLQNYLSFFIIFSTWIFYIYNIYWWSIIWFCLTLLISD